MNCVSYRMLNERGCVPWRKYRSIEALDVREACLQASILAALEKQGRADWEKKTKATVQKKLAEMRAKKGADLVKEFLWAIEQAAKWAEVGDRRMCRLRRNQARRCRAELNRMIREQNKRV